MKLLRLIATTVGLVYLVAMSLTVHFFFNQGSSNTNSGNSIAASNAQDNTLIDLAVGNREGASTDSTSGSNSEVDKALGQSDENILPKAPATLIATFGSGAMADFILNWAANVQGIPSLHPFFVFALDEELRDVCVKHGYNVILVPEVWIFLAGACSAGNILQYIEKSLDSGLRPTTLPDSSKSEGGKSGGKSNTAYYRHDIEAFRLMGANKALFLHLLLRSGYDVLLSDADTVWLSDPWQWIPRHGDDGQEMHPLAIHFKNADMLVSTDTAEPLRMYWPQLITTEHNTGILWMRACNATILLTAEWHFQSMTFSGSTHDQTELNFILKGHYPTPGVTASLENKNKPGERYPYIPHFVLSDYVAASTAAEGENVFLPDRTQHFVSLAEKYPTLNGLEVPQVDVDRAKELLKSEISNAVNDLYPKDASAFLSNMHHKSNKEIGFLTFLMWQGRVVVGMLPLNVFLNGMSFFTFGVQQELPASSPPLRPVVVHATYQFADEAEYSYGKRQRFREHGLWKIDPPSYYQGQYLQIVEWESIIVSMAKDYQKSLTEAGKAAAAEAMFRCENGSDYRFPLDPSLGCFHPGHVIVDLDAKQSVLGYKNQLSSGVLNLRTAEDPAELHLKVQSALRMVLRNAFAIANPTNRAVILPELWCLCARFWWIASDCILVGQDNHVGAAYNCPLDHNIMPGRLLQDKQKGGSDKKPLLDFREPRFLDHASQWLKANGNEIGPQEATRLVKADSSAKADVKVTDMDHGIEGVIATVSTLGDRRVLSVSASDLLDLGNCGYSDTKKTNEFNNILASAFPRSQHIFFCSRERNPQFYIESIAAKANRDGADPMNYIKADFNCTGTDPSFPRGFHNLGPPPFETIFCRPNPYGGWTAGLLTLADPVGVYLNVQGVCAFRYLDRSRQAGRRFMPKE